MNGSISRQRIATGFALTAAALMGAVGMQITQSDSAVWVLGVALTSLTGLVLSTEDATAIGLLRSPSTLFGLGLFVCNLGETFLTTIGLAPDIKDPIARAISQGADSYRGEAGLMAGFGVCAFSAGVAFTRVLRKKNRITRRQIPTPAVRESGNSRPITDVAAAEALLAAIVSLGFAAVFVIESIRTGTVAGLYAGAGEPSRLLILSSQMAFTSAVISAALAAPRTQAVRLMWSSAVFMLLFMSILGWRGHTFAFFAAIIVCRARWMKAFPFRRVAVGYVVVAVVWAVTADVRQTVVSDRDYRESVRGIAENVGTVLTYPFGLAAAQESSLRYAIAFAHEFGFGGTTWYWNHLSFAIPNITGPARQSGSEVGSGLSATVSATYVGSYGIGLTPVGEAFASFGAAGTLIVLLVTGLCAASIEAAAGPVKSGRTVATLGIVAAAGFWWLRNDSLQLFRFILWGLALEAAIFFVARLAAARKPHHALLERCAQ